MARILRYKAAHTFGGGGASGGATADDGTGGVGGGVAAVPATGAGGSGLPSPRARAEAWAPTAEQDHNLQLLELVAKLREALLGIPALVASAGETTLGGGAGGEASTRQVRGVVGAV